MLRRRPRALAAAVAIAALSVGACGRDDFENDPRPPVPAEVAAKIADDGVAVSPREFGAGLAHITIANLTSEPGVLVIRGPVDGESDEIPPAGTATLTMDMRSGEYEASVDGIAVAPGRFSVGPERPSAKNELLLP
jgi:hypothetical protein